MLVVSDIVKSFATSVGQLEVISDFSLTVEPSEIVSIVGPSGCGKSTLIRLCAGLESLDSGRISLSSTDGLAAQASIAFQEHGLLPWLTVEANIALGVDLRGDFLKEAAAVDVIERVGLAGFNKSYPDQLSGGMKSRASLARALLMEGAIALLDEPFRSLDEATRFAVGRDCTALLRAKQQSALLVTHSISEAIRLADRVVVVSPRPMKIIAEHVVDLSVEDRQSIDSIGVEEASRALRKIVFETAYAG